MGEFTAFEWLALVQHELLLFAGVFFLVGALDELSIDFAWLWLRLTGRAPTWRIDRAEACGRPLSGPAAVLIPCWHEERIIAETVAHALAVWPQEALRLYVGCYRNDTPTLEAVLHGAGSDPRVRLVVLERDGPSTKADCLNRLYAALADDERRAGERFRLVVLHDAEDMVDPAALPLLDRAIEEAAFVQLPVIPEAQLLSRWIGSHYCEEFAEQHGKGMVVRDALGVGLPASGVGCGFSREMLERVAERMGTPGPFPVDSLTEDYELGLRIREVGGRSRFLRVRGEDGELVATRACFPARIDQAVRQKARWVHGIALQGWDRMGWSGGVTERWMRLRDRRGPLSALVLFIGYTVLLTAPVVWLASELGWARPLQPDPLRDWLIWLNLIGFAWRALVRATFTAREYGVGEGLLAVLRIPFANAIAIMATRRAIWTYLKTLCGGPMHWDKTFHHAHPAPRRATA